MDLDLTTCRDLYINGAWQPGASGERFDVFNPATEEVLASVASAEIADADAALNAAQAAFADWASRSRANGRKCFARHGS